jgi:hypothetical protein
MTRRLPTTLALLTLLGCDPRSGEPTGPPPRSDGAALPDASPADGTSRLETGVDAGPPSDARPDGAGPGDARPVAEDGASVPGEGGAWIDAPALPAPRQEIGVVAFADEIWVLGGFDDQGRVVPDVFIFEPTAGVWRAGPALPTPMHHANVAVAAGRIWVLGFLTGLDFRADGRAYVYDPAVGAWHDAPPLPAGQVRGASGVAVLDDGVHLVGGLAGGQAVRLHTRFDPTTGLYSPRAEAPRSVDHVAAGALQGRLHLVGGRARNISAHTDAHDIYDPIADAWSSGPPLPTSRAGGAAVTLGERLYVFGGEGARNPSGVFAEAEAFDVQTERWTRLTPMGRPRHGNGAAAAFGRIHIPGGAPVEAFGAVADHEIFDP